MSGPLLNRLVLAAVEALDEDDPLLTIEIGDRELRLSWRPDD